MRCAPLFDYGSIWRNNCRLSWRSYGLVYCYFNRLKHYYDVITDVFSSINVYFSRFGATVRKVNSLNIKTTWQMYRWPTDGKWLLAILYHKQIRCFRQNETRLDGTNLAKEPFQYSEHESQNWFPEYIKITNGTQIHTVSINGPWIWVTRSNIWFILGNLFRQPSMERRIPTGHL